jgi:translation initiation factor IF-2
LQAAKRQREEQEVLRRTKLDELSEKLAARKLFTKPRKSTQPPQTRPEEVQQFPPLREPSREQKWQERDQQRKQKPNQYNQRPFGVSPRAVDPAANRPLNRVQTAQRENRALDLKPRHAQIDHFEFMDHLEKKVSGTDTPSPDARATEQEPKQNKRSARNNNSAPQPVSKPTPMPQFKNESNLPPKTTVKPPSWMNASPAASQPTNPPPPTTAPSSAAPAQSLNPLDDPFATSPYEDIFSGELEQARKAFEPVPAPPPKIRYAVRDFETPTEDPDKLDTTRERAHKTWQQNMDARQRSSEQNEQREQPRQQRASQSNNLSDLASSFGNQRFRPTQSAAQPPPQPESQSVSSLSAAASGLSQEEEKMLAALLARKNKLSPAPSASPLDSLFSEQDQQTRRALVDESKMRVQAEQVKKAEENRSRGPRFTTVMVNSRDEPDETPFENAQNWSILKSRRQSTSQNYDQPQARQQTQESNNGGRSKFSPISAGDIDARFEEYRQRRPRFGNFKIESLNVESRPPPRVRPGQTCVRCGELGHEYRQCPNPARPGWVDRAPGQKPPMRGERFDRNAPRGDRDERRPRDSRSAGRDMAAAYGSSAATGTSAEAEEIDPAEVEAARRLAERNARRASRFVEEDDAVDAPRAAPVKGRRNRSEEMDDDADDDDKPRRGRRRFDDEDDIEGNYGAMRNNRDERKKARQAKKDKAAKEAARQAARQARRAEAMTPINLPEFVSVSKLAQLTNVTYQEMAEKMEDLGFENTSHDHILGAEEAGLIAMEYNFDPTLGAQDEAEAEERDLKALPELAAEDKEFLPVRPPVVAIMGHVDHGKTTILDYLRKSSIAASEHGGITQHIGAFSVALSSGKTITFLDTPGHAAFLEMRKRGATVTDIIILVVAADDSVKPQTIEAIKHAQSAHVPIIVAVNKIDKEEANVDRVKQDLARHGVEIEDFGGDTQVVPVSGKTGQGIDELEDAAVTLSEILDHRADTEGQVEGWVIEATTKSNGRVATVLVRRGTLKPGTIIVAGKTWARVRSLRNEAGVVQMSAGPGTPIEVDGWRDQPEAGDEVLQAPNEQKAADVVSFRDEVAERIRMAEDMEKINAQRREQQVQRDATKEAAAAEKAAEKAARAGGTEIEAPTTTRKPTLDANDNETPGHQTVPFIIKADVSGSVEAVSAYLLQMTNPLCSPKLLRASVGPVSEFDIEHADAAGGHIISFNLPPDPDSAGRAERKGIKLLEQNVIYRIVDDVRAVLEEKLPPQKIQKVTGEAEVAMSFEIGVGGRKKMKIAGLKVRNGVVARGSRVRVTRGEERVYDGRSFFPVFFPLLSTKV